MRRSLLIILALLLLAPVALYAADKQPDLSQRLGQLDAQVSDLRAGVDDLEANFAKEIDERDRLMLRRRFVEGREFFYEVQDYRGASEVFYSIVNHPLAPTLPNLTEAMFYLAESLFHAGYLVEAKYQYQRIAQRGPSDYFGMSLIRQIEIAVEQRDFAEAERLYVNMLSQFPEGEDGSLGRYVIGKSYFLRGETAKAIEIFDAIPEDGAYYATAQYYAAAVYVKQRNFREAINRLRHLKETLKGDAANKKKIFALTHLALARVFYEMNDFPQAMANYRAVPADTEDYPEALYESIWVFITRNDYLLKAIQDERDGYESVLFDFTEFQDSVEYQNDGGDLDTVADEAKLLQGDLDEMGAMFDEIDTGLARLQAEAVDSYNKLVQAAPGNPLVPQAELLVGDVYSQVEDYENGEQWFRRLYQKYEDYYASVAAAAQRIQGADYIELVQAASTSDDRGLPLPSGVLKGMPEEVAYWLAADPEVRRIFSIYEAAQQEREDVMKMRELIGEVEQRLREMEAGVDYPILHEANRRRIEYRDRIQALQVEILSLRNDAAGADDETRAAINSQTAGYEGLLQNLQARLDNLEPQIEAKKQERLAFYRQELAAARAPIGEFQQSIDALAGSTGGTLAEVAAAEMANLQAQIKEYAQKADLGVIDVAWRATRGSSREIKKIQHEMEQELRQYRQQTQGDPGAAPPAEDNATEPTPEPEPAADDPSEEGGS